MTSAFKLLNSFCEGELIFGSIAEDWANVVSNACPINSKKFPIVFCSYGERDSTRIKDIIYPMDINSVGERFDSNFEYETISDLLILLKIHTAFFII